MLQVFTMTLLCMHDAQEVFLECTDGHQWRVAKELSKLPLSGGVTVIVHTDRHIC